MSELVLATLARVWLALQPLGTQMAVAGGLAVGLWKNPRGTRDVDLLIAVEPPSLPDLYARLAEIGMRPERTRSRWN